MNQLGRLVAMLAMMVGGAQLGCCVTRMLGDGNSFLSKSGPVGGWAGADVLAAYDGEGHSWVDGVCCEIVGGPAGIGGKWLDRAASPPVGCRERGGVPGPNLGE